LVVSDLMVFGQFLSLMKLLSRFIDGFNPLIASDISMEAIQIFSFTVRLYCYTILGKKHN
jgi:hypothetical protein